MEQSSQYHPTPILSSLPKTIVWRMERQTMRYLFVSPQSKTVLGVPPAHWLTDAQFWLTHIHPDDQTAVRQAFATSHKSGESFVIQYRFCLGNQHFWLEDEVTVENGQSWVGLRRDVSPTIRQLKKVEESQDGLAKQLKLASFEKRMIQQGLTAVSSTMPLSTVLSALANYLTEALDATSAYILEVDEKVRTITVTAEYISANASPREQRSDLGIIYELLPGELEMIASFDKIATVFHLNQPNLPTLLQHLAEQYDAKTIVVLPIAFQHHFLGYVEIWDTRSYRTFTKTELALAEAIVNQADHTLHNAFLIRDEQLRRQDAEKIVLIASHFIDTLNLDKILSRTMEVISYYLGEIQNCAISSLEENGRYLRSIFEWTSHPDHSFVPLGDGVWVDETEHSRQVLLTRQILYTHLVEGEFHTERTQSLYDQGLRTFLYIPLKIRQKIIGILHINVFDHYRYFTSEEIKTVEAIASFASMAISNAKLLISERKQLHLAQTLQKMGRIVIAQLSPLEVYEQMLSLLKEVVPYDWASFQLYEPRTKRLITVAGFDETFYKIKIVQPRLVSKAILARINEPPYWTFIPDTASDPSWVQSKDPFQPVSWIGAALRVKEQFLGLLSVTHYEYGHFTEELGQTVATFANQAAIAIETARLHDQMKQRVAELSILHQIANSTTDKATDIDRLLSETTKAVAASRYPDVFGFALIDKESNKVYMHPSTHGIPEPYLSTAYPLTDCFIGAAILAGQPKISGNVRKESAYLGSVPSTVSEITVPLWLDGKVIGAIDAESTHPHAFDQTDLQFLTTLARQISAAIEHSRLTNALRAQAKKLSEMVRQRTAELQAERDKTIAILHHAGEGVWLTDTNLNVEFMNPAVSAQSGFSEAELLGRPIWQLLNNLNDINDAHLKRAFASQQAWKGEIVNRHKNGRSYDVALSISPILNKQGSIINFVGVQANISRLKEADRLKSQFISNISHELKTPITSIKTYLTLVERGRPEKKARYIYILNQETDRLTHLIEDLLDLSRLETIVHTNLHAVANLPIQAQNSIELLQPVWEAKAQQVELHAAEEEIWLAMEPHHLTKLLHQLLENAILYSPSQHTVTLTLRKESASGQAVIQLTDAGQGISDEELSLIFDRFYRGQAARELNNPGTGLGLAIVQTIVELYGGQIEVSSQPAAGTTFTIHLPLASALGH